KPRKNELVRPPVANIDQAIIISSATMPEFSPLLLDRFLVLIESKRIEPIIFITKSDATTAEEKQKNEAYQKDYQEIGYTAEFLTTKNPHELTRLFHFFTNNISVIAGQSGVGKSSLLNALNPSLFIKTDDVSKSLGRGKHTTSHVELVEVGSGLVADTPGFSSLDFNEIETEELADCFPEMSLRKEKCKLRGCMHDREQKCDIKEAVAQGEINEYSYDQDLNEIEPEEFADCFPEMSLRKEKCKYRGCMHDREPKCAIKEAVAQGEINAYRYDHYLSFLKEIQSRKPRY